MKPGDRVMWWGGLGGFNRVYGTLILPDTQFNSRSYKAVEGWWVRPDGWDHNYFVGTVGLYPME